MRKLIFICLCVASIQSAFAQELFQLAPPLLKYTSIFFSGHTSLEIKFDQPGAEVRYTTNGQEPTAKDLLYTGPISISNNRLMIKAKAMGKQFLPSETVSVEFIKQGKDIQEITGTAPNPSYSGSMQMLHDGKAGRLMHNTGTWLGYNTDTVALNIELNKKERVKSVMVNVLQNQGSWIFLPEQIQLYYFNEKKQAYLPVASKLFANDKPSPARQCSFLEMIPEKKISTSKLKLVLYPVKQMPDWHASKGKHAWLLIDEINVF